MSQAAITMAVKRSNKEGYGWEDIHVKLNKAGFRIARLDVKIAWDRVISETS